MSDMQRSTGKQSDRSSQTRNRPESCVRPKLPADEEAKSGSAQSSGSSSSSTSGGDSSESELDMLCVDKETRSQIAVVAVTILLFLLTHSPAEPKAPLDGVFTQGVQMAQACFIERPYPITAICDILGFASMTRLLDGCDGFLQEMTLTWSRVIWGMCDLSRDVYGPSREQSEKLHRASGASYDHAVEKTFSTYHWHILREMCYHSRVLHNQDPNLRRTEKLTPRDEGLQMWLKDESDRETGNRSFISWYRVSVQEKIALLNRMRKFMTRRLPAERMAENRPFEETSCLMELAGAVGGDMLRDFLEMRGLQGWIDRQLEYWKGVGLYRQEQGLGMYNPVYSGFPLSRLYRSGIEAPDPARQERREGIYPENVVELDRKKRREEEDRGDR